MSRHVPVCPRDIWGQSALPTLLVARFDAALAVLGFNQADDAGYLLNREAEGTKTTKQIGCDLHPNSNAPDYFPTQPRYSGFPQIHFCPQKAACSSLCVALASPEHVDNVGVIAIEKLAD